jgi:hypothetical protein
MDSILNASSGAFATKVELPNNICRNGPIIANETNENATKSRLKNTLRQPKPQYGIIYLNILLNLFIVF